MPDPQKETAICEQMIPTWVATMRQAAVNSLKESDITEIVNNQIALAKKGDKNAIKFVFEQILGGAYVKGATFIQNNYTP